MAEPDLPIDTQLRDFLAKNNTKNAPPTNPFGGYDELGIPRLPFYARPGDTRIPGDIPIARMMVGLNPARQQMFQQAQQLMNPMELFRQRFQQLYTDPVLRPYSSGNASFVDPNLRRLMPAPLMPTPMTPNQVRAWTPPTVSPFNPYTDRRFPQQMGMGAISRGGMGFGGVGMPQFLGGPPQNFRTRRVRDRQAAEQANSNAALAQVRADAGQQQGAPPLPPPQQAPSMSGPPRQGPKSYDGYTYKANNRTFKVVGSDVMVTNKSGKFVKWGAIGNGGSVIRKGEVVGNMSKIKNLIPPSMSGPPRQGPYQPQGQFNIGGFQGYKSQGQLYVKPTAQPKYKGTYTFGDLNYQFAPNGQIMKQDASGKWVPTGFKRNSRQLFLNGKPYGRLGATEGGGLSLTLQNGQVLQGTRFGQQQAAPASLQGPPSGKFTTGGLSGHLSPGQLYVRPTPQQSYQGMYTFGDKNYQFGLGNQVLEQNAQGKWVPSPFRRRGNQLLINGNPYGTLGQVNGQNLSLTLNGGNTLQGQRYYPTPR